MSKKIQQKKLAVFTSIRSEYGMLTPLIKNIHASKEYELQLIVGGAHLSKEHGYTVKEIMEDGFPISIRLDFLKKDKSEAGIILSELVRMCNEYLKKNKPDLLFVLGDRFELLGICSVALLHGIPIAHICGGEVTEGSFDNQVRNAVTKIAHLHFPNTKYAEKNVLAMGEEKWRVKAVGELFLDYLNDFKPMSKAELYKQLGLKMEKPVALATFHPETIDNKITSEFVLKLLLKTIKETPHQLVVTASNFDPGGKEINEILVKLSKTNADIIFIESLGKKRYYSLLHYVDFVFGNSSSGLIEVQSFNKPVINVGKRQQGRLSNPNVLNAGYDTNELLQSFDYTLSSEFQEKFRNKKNIYGDGHASEKIIAFIKSIDFDKLLLKKSTF